jgi:hypothetical protein
MLQLPPHPPYSSNPTIGANPTRLWISSGELYKIAGDPEEAVKFFYKTAGMENPPFRLMLHPIAVNSAQTRIESIQKGMDGSKQWSEELFQGGVVFRK